MVNILPCPFLFGKLPMEEQTSEFSTWWENTFNELKKENIKALNKTMSKINPNRIQVGELEYVVSGDRVIKSTDTSEYKTLANLGYYWNSVTFLEWKNKIKDYATYRVDKLYTDVFEGEAEVWTPIISCSFRTCLTATMVSLALSLYKSKIPGISTPLADIDSSGLSPESTSYVSDGSSPVSQPSPPRPLTTTPIQESTNNEKIIRLEILNSFVENIKKKKHIETEGIFRIPGDEQTVNNYYKNFKATLNINYLNRILSMADTHEMVSLFKKLLFDNDIKKSYFYPHITYEEIEDILINLSKDIVSNSDNNNMGVDGITTVIAMQLQNINPKFKGMTLMDEANQTKHFIEEIKHKIESYSE